MTNKKDNKTSKVLEWNLIFDSQSREMYIECPICKTEYKYNILGVKGRCPQCNSMIMGVNSDNQRTR